MSTSFNFPANPTLNQIVVLPDGNSAQWNGYAWVSVTDNPTYPLAIPKGGTGATNPDTALTNLGGGATGVPIFKSATAAAARQILGLDGTIPWLLQDGTVAAPGLAWASEPGLGWYRSAASHINMAVGGAQVIDFDFGTSATDTRISMYPRAVGRSGLEMLDSPKVATTYNGVGIGVNTAGPFIVERLFGGAASKPLTLSFVAGVTVNTSNVSQVSPAGSNAIYVLRKSTAANASDLVGYLNSEPRWSLRLGDGSGNDNFAILRYSGGVLTGTCMTIDRSNGGVQFPEAAGVAVMGSGGLNVSTGPLNVAGSVNAANGMRLLWDGATANYLTMGAGATVSWSWQWNRTNGQLAWLGGASQQLILFGGDGSAGKAAGGTAWFVISDKRAKKDVVDWDGGLEKVLSLRPREFTRVDTGEHCIGCVADEAEEGFPDLIKRAPGKIGEVEYDDVATLHIDPLYWALVNSVKTLHQRLAAIGA